MSRPLSLGLKVLAVLEETPDLTARQVAEAIYGHQPNGSQRTGMFQCLRHLRRRGLVVGRVNSDRPPAKLWRLAP